MTVFITFNAAASQLFKQTVSVTGWEKTIQKRHVIETKEKKSRTRWVKSEDAAVGPGHWGGHCNYMTPKIGDCV